MKTSMIPDLEVRMAQGKVCVYGEGGCCIAIFDSSVSANKENAEHFVKAVKNHRRLIDSLEQCMKALSSYGNEEEYKSSINFQLKEAATVLKAAKGE